MVLYTYPHTVSYPSQYIYSTTVLHPSYVAFSLRDDTDDNCRYSDASVEKKKRDSRRSMQSLNLMEVELKVSKKRYFEVLFLDGNEGMEASQKN